MEETGRNPYDTPPYATSPPVKSVEIDAEIAAEVEDAPSNVPVNEQTILDEELIPIDTITDYYGSPVQLKKSVADSLVRAANDLKTKHNINIKIADNYVSKEIKQAAFEKYEKDSADYRSQGYYRNSEGKKVYSPPPKQAGRKSFHTHGQAIDLVQSKEMKNEKVFAALRAQGFKQHPDEWWHWSIGEFTEG